AFRYGAAPAPPQADPQRARLGSHDGGSPSSVRALRAKGASVREPGVVHRIRANALRSLYGESDVGVPEAYWTRARARSWHGFGISGGAFGPAGRRGVLRRNRARTRAASAGNH